MPFMMFYISDWLKDTRRLNRATKGDWIDLLCAMWDAPTRGRLQWSLAAYARHLGVSIDTAHGVLTELLETGTADGGFQETPAGRCGEDCPSDHRGDVKDHINCHQLVTVINRRMTGVAWTRKRKAKNQQDARDRKTESPESHRTVTAESPDISHKSEVIYKNKRGEESQPSPEGRRSAQTLSDKIFENHPTRTAPTEAVLMEWSREADRIYNIDKHGWEEILSLIEWSQVDPFWKTNILSMSKFRKQWNQLTAHRSRGGEHGQAKQTALESIAGYAKRQNIFDKK